MNDEGYKIAKLVVGVLAMLVFAMVSENAINTYYKLTAVKAGVPALEAACIFNNNT
ncbi:hypothetical protein LCGC14_1989460 [marine sediment metagenome]|uniref:Uncharacterized protein n=1 Tax=marine sediment metagenome TaxID=412755 RepID=A0A0F9I3J2_9ZZZZ